MDYHKEHIKLWTWIADETLKRKRKVNKHEYFAKYDISEMYAPFGYCYACEASLSHFPLTMVKHSPVCISCPLDWGENRRCGEKLSLYREWGDCEESNYKRAAKLARQIAALPWNDKEKILV